MMQIREDENKERESFVEPSETKTALAPQNSYQEKFMRKLTTALRQLGDIIDYETQALSEHTNPDFNDIKAKKARSLQTLTQLSNDSKTIEFDEVCKVEIQAQFEHLQKKLARNQHLLQTHMEAVNELVEMIHAAADAQETDGTYDPYSHTKQLYKGVLQ